jgi:hypothetical protein
MIVILMMTNPDGGSWNYCAFCKRTTKHGADGKCDTCGM